MNIDDIINEAFDSSLPGEGLFIVEGNPAKNLFRILPADEAFKMNLDAFAWDINTGFQYMGIFTEESLAEKFIERVRNNVRNEEGKRLF